jgi:arylsulfatase A-like enzyme
VKTASYETALIGKWHLGWKPEFGPNRHGDDEFFGILSSAHAYFTHPLEWPGTGGPRILE